MWFGILIISVLAVDNVLGDTNSKTTVKMPTMFKFDNYQEAMSSSNPSPYCLVFGEIQPDNSSDLWHAIDAFVQDPVRRFRHDHIIYGFNVDKCKQLLRDKGIVVETQTELDETRIPQDEVVDFFKRIFTEDDYKDRLQYQDLLDKCMNLEIQGKYNLSVKTFIEYCDKNPNKEEMPSKDGMSRSVYVVIGILVVLNIASSFYDYFVHSPRDSGKSQIEQSTKKEGKPNLGVAILTSFSISRNYRQLTQAKENDDEFRFFYFYRLVTAIIVIFGHVYLGITTMPLKNPEFVEGKWDEAWSMICQNGNVTIQIFFIMTAFHTKLSFDKRKVITPRSSFAKSASLYITVIAHRYLRLLPSLAALIYFESKILYHLGSGPFWRHINQAGNTFCQQYWWKNIFLVNIFLMDESCSQHTWYISTDVHLFMLYTLLIIVTAKFPRLKKPIYITMATLSFLILGTLTYIYRLDVNVYLKPELYRYLYFKFKDTFYTTYITFYGNLGGYLMGILCAEWYQTEHFSKTKERLSKYARNVFVQIPFVIAHLYVPLTVLYTAVWVIDKNNGEPSLWLALYSAGFRNLWVLYGGFSVMMMAMKWGWIAYDLCSMEMFRTVGRLTFGMFIWHAPILRIISGLYRDSLELSDAYVGSLTITVSVLSMSIAFIFSLLVEFPLGNLVNLLFRYVSKSSVQENSQEKKQK
uniref:Acyltransferase 3 domain-containing protein n=1 Tax=Stomoxys calcitrans TaxID=35570 RepID=A0A1I8NPU5_STOCA